MGNRVPDLLIYQYTISYSHSYVYIYIFIYQNITHIRAQKWDHEESCSQSTSISIHKFKFTFIYIYISMHRIYIYIYIYIYMYIYIKWDHGQSCSRPATTSIQYFILIFMYTHIYMHVSKFNTYTGPKNGTMENRVRDPLIYHNTTHIQGPKMGPWGIVFPNHFHAPPGHSHIPDTYSMEQFLAANSKQFKKHPLFKAGAWLGDVQGLRDSGVPSWHIVPVLYVCICIYTYLCVCLYIYVYT